MSHIIITAYLIFFLVHIGCILELVCSGYFSVSNHYLLMTYFDLQSCGENNLKQINSYLQLWIHTILQTFRIFEIRFLSKNFSVNENLQWKIRRNVHFV